MLGIFFYELLRLDGPEDVVTVCDVHRRPESELKILGGE